MSARVVRIVLVLIAVAVAGCDQGTKRWAEEELAGQAPVTVVQGRAELTYTQNPGSAFRFDRLAPEVVRAPLLWGSAIAVLGVLGVAWWRQRRVDVPAVAGALIAGGAAGNLIDRAARGYVVDFVHVHGWPVFNVADVALVAGGALVLVAALRARPAAASPPGRPSV